jgi:hypothetical protein
MVTYLRAWWIHFGINLGMFISAGFAMFLPPRWHHTKEQCDAMARKTFRSAFLYGSGFLDEDEWNDDNQN